MWPATRAESSTASIRPRRRDAVSGFSCQIGWMTLRISCVNTAAPEGPEVARRRFRASCAIGRDALRCASLLLSRPGRYRHNDRRSLSQPSHADRRAGHRADRSLAPKARASQWRFPWPLRGQDNSRHQGQLRAVYHSIGKRKSSACRQPCLSIRR